MLKKITLWILAVFAILIGLVILVIFARKAFVSYQAKHALESSYCQLMVKTNHQQLLEACRNLSKKYPDKEWILKDNRYEFHYGYENENPELPETIAQLKPAIVCVRGDLVYIGLRKAALGIAGIVAYPDDIKEVENCVQLVPGLFFYDKRFHGNRPAFEEYLHKLAKREIEKLYK